MFANERVDSHHEQTRYDGRDCTGYVGCFPSCLVAYESFLEHEVVPVVQSVRQSAWLGGWSFGALDSLSSVWNTKGLLLRPSNRKYCEAFSLYIRFL